jgi:hypothetical protein
VRNRSLNIAELWCTQSAAHSQNRLKSADFEKNNTAKPFGCAVAGRKCSSCYFWDFQTEKRHTHHQLKQFGPPIGRTSDNLATITASAAKPRVQAGHLCAGQFKISTSQPWELED